MIRTLSSLLLLLCLLLVACPGADDDDLPAGLEGRCGLDETGPAVDLAITEASDLVVEEQTTSAQNTVDIEFASPPALPALGGVRVGSCGEMGLAALLPDVGQLVYADLDSGGVTVLADPATSRPGLLFDDTCAPLVLVTEGATVVEHWREGQTWSARTALDGATMGVNGSLTLTAIDPAHDGSLHLLALAPTGDGLALLHASRSAAAGSDWSAELLDPPDASRVWDYAVDGQGGLHAVFERSDFPCDPCDVALRHAVLQGGGGWQESMVEEGMWGPPHDEMSVDASLTIDGQDRPVIAASFRTRAVTGSLQSQALRVYALRDGEFCAEQPLTESDGYAGSDGTDFTGALPTVAVDADGRLHVLFTDVAAWHGSNGWSNTITGQLRYALRAGTGWQSATIRSQDGPTVTPQPLSGVAAPSLAVSPGGDAAAVGLASWSWDTDSIYNDTSVPLDITTELLGLQTAAR